MTILRRTVGRALFLVVMIAWLWPGRCFADPVIVSAVTVLHDGRSVLIEASPADDPAVFSAVDWVPGWLDGDAAVLTVSRGNSTFTAELIFTGATIRMGTGDPLSWNIYALISSPGDVVITSDTVTATIDEGWLEDSAGNVLDAESAFPVTSYSLVGTDGFIDESAFTFVHTVYVDLADGDDLEMGNPPPTAAQVWTAARNIETPLKTLRRALALYNDPVASGAGSSCAIRILRGTTGDADTLQIDIERGGASRTSPLLISTYEIDPSPHRPHITFPGVRSGLVREAGADHADFVYINGIHLERTGIDDGSASGVVFRKDDSHLVVSDCIIDGFFNNVEFDNSLVYGLSHSRWWSVFRNVIIDAHDGGGGGNPQGVFADGCQQGLLICQNAMDRNGWKDNDFEVRNTHCHNIYMAHEHHAPPGALVWGNAITRAGGSGCMLRPGGVIYGNIFADTTLGCMIGGHESEGGGRIARNYFERGEDFTALDGFARGWGPGVGSDTTSGTHHYGPSIVELNCIANSEGTAPRGVWIDKSYSELFSAPEIVVRNNTARAHGPLTIALDDSDPSPPVVVSERNVWDSRGSPSSFDRAMAFSNWPLEDPVLLFQQNLYLSTSSNSIDLEGTAISLTTWQVTYNQDPSSISSTPTYAEDEDADLGDLAVHLSVGTTIDDYYDAIRERGLGEWPEVFEFVAGAAWLIGQREVSGFQGTPLPSPHPLSFWGSGDGSDPQIP